MCRRPHRFDVGRLEWMASVFPGVIPEKVIRLDIVANPGEIPGVDRRCERMHQSRLTLRLRPN